MTTTRTDPFYRIGQLEAELDSLIEAIETASRRVEIPAEIVRAAEFAARGRGGRGKHDLRLATERERKDAARARKRAQKERLAATDRARLWTGPIGGEP